MNDKKQACGRFYRHTEVKIVNDETLYKTIPEAGTRHLPLGYFRTEEEAVDALYEHLKLKKLI